MRYDRCAPRNIPSALNLARLGVNTATGLKQFAGRTGSASPLPIEPYLCDFLSRPRRLYSAAIREWASAIRLKRFSGSDGPVPFALSKSIHRPPPLRTGRSLLLYYRYNCISRKIVSLLRMTFRKSTDTLSTVSRARWVFTPRRLSQGGRRWRQAPPAPPRSRPTPHASQLSWEGNSFDV